MKVAQSNSLDKLNQITILLQKYKVHHILFWIVYFVFWVWIYKSFYENIIQLLWVTLFYSLSHASLYYLSQYLLIPRILKTNKPFLFFLAFAFLAALLSVLMYIGISLALSADLRILFSASIIQVLLIFFTSNIFIGSMLLFAKGFLENRKNLRKEELKERERIESELNFLKSQVNPHFLFNAINSVYVLIKLDPEKASDTLIKLSNLLRSQLYEFSSETIDIQKEIEYLENYIELEQIRKGDRLTIEFQKGEGLHDFQIYPLLFIPFLENCFKHLSSYPDKKNEIQFKIERNNGTLKAEFFNTKESSGNIKEQDMGGIGLKNIKRRLDLLYPNNYFLDITDSPNSFLVDLKIKL
jgi:two-component system, LytTR family, sensor kinase